MTAAADDLEGAGAGAAVGLPATGPGQPDGIRSGRARAWFPPVSVPVGSGRAGDAQSPSGRAFSSWLRDETPSFMKTLRR